MKGRGRDKGVWREEEGKKVIGGRKEEGRRKVIEGRREGQR